MMNETKVERSILDILLDGTARNVSVDRPTADYRIRRLSKENGCDVVFKLQGIGYDRAVELSKSATMDIDMVLDCVVEPNLRDVRLARKLGVLEEGRTWADSPATPPDVVKALLLPGEIAALSRCGQQLAGYQVVTVQEVKKN